MNDIKALIDKCAEVRYEPQRNYESSGAYTYYPHDDINCKMKIPSSCLNLPRNNGWKHGSFTDTGILATQSGI